MFLGQMNVTFTSVTLNFQERIPYWQCCSQSLTNGMYTRGWTNAHVTRIPTSEAQFSGSMATTKHWTVEPDAEATIKVSLIHLFLAMSSF